MTDVDVSELNRLAVDLQRGSLAVQRQVSTVLDKVAGDIVATAQQFAPVDTGATKSSISWSADGVLAREIGPTTHYAPYLEYGTARMAPYAFMGPALDRHSPDLVRALGEITARVL